MPKRAGRPPRISRADILAATRQIAETEGPAALTMRRVAREVGTTAMALYHHVRDKDDLLQLLLDEHAAGVPLPDPVADDPAERATEAATAMRSALNPSPWMVDILRADDLLARRALRFPEAIIDALMDAGLNTEDAVDAYRIIWHYTAGEISARAAAARRRAEDRPTYRGQVFADLDPAELPRLAAIGARWEELAAHETYDKGLRALVRGLLPPGGETTLRP